MCRGYTLPPPCQRERGRSGSRPHRKARRRTRYPPHERDHYMEHLPQLDTLVPRPAAHVQPVVQRHAVGNAHPPLPPYIGIPVARGAHGTRNARGSRGRSKANAESLCRLCRTMARRSGGAGREERDRTLCRSTRHLHHRSHDAGRKGTPERHVALPRAELCQVVRRYFPQ